jgi:hypothetical protein
LLLLPEADAALIAFRSGRTQQTDESTIEHFAHRDEPATGAVPAAERKPAEILAERFEDVRNRLRKAI